MRQNLPVTQRDFALPPGQTLVSVTDLKGRIVYCNEAFVSVSGFSRDELMGQPHNLVRHPDMPAEAFRDMWTTIQSGMPWTALVKNRRKNGDHYWVVANATPMRKGHGIVGYLSVRTAPTAAQVQAAEALYARMRAEASNRRLTTVLSRGQVLNNTLGGRAMQAMGRCADWVGWAGVTNLLAMAGAGAACLWLPAGFAALAVAALFGVSHQVTRGAAQAQLKTVVNDALTLASGDLTHEVHRTHRGQIGDLELALGQLAVNMRTVIGDVRDEVDNVRLAVAEIASGNQDLSSRTEAQASSLEQTAASMEEINGTVRQSAATAARGAQVAGETAALAQRSHEGVLDVVKAMEQINDSSKRIHEIIHVIEGVAFQTNILALNAAVEAARAGDAGRGFAVVAAEVRTLAQRTSTAAREIKTLIGEATERADSGRRQTHAARDRMQEALHSVDQVTTLLSEISVASQEQQTGVAQVNEAVTHMDGITQQNAAMVEELAASAQSLNGRVQSVTDSMRLFRLRPGELTVAEADAVGLRREAASHH